MASFDDLLSKARSAPRPHRDVDVTLDQAVAAQVAEIDAEIDTLEQERLELLGDLRMADPRPAEIAARIGELAEQRDTLTDGTLVTFRFTQLPAQEWAELGARNPVRLDVAVDRVAGYNYHAVAKAAAAASGARLLPDGTLEQLTSEQWDGLWEVISGVEFERIASALWDLNDYGPTQRIASAKKASRAGSGSTSN